MQQTNDLFKTSVVGKQNFDALDEIYTADARVLPPGAEMVEGRAQIKSFWRGAISGMKIQDATLTTVEAMSLGDQIFEIGRADLTVGEGQVVKIKYVVLWKQEDGRWKWHVDIWNPNS